jgi:transposase
MTSDRKADSNRKNSQKSTGPRSDNGRRNSGRNALRHGLAVAIGARITVSTDALRGNDFAKAMDYMLKAWIAFMRFLGVGRTCLSNNAAERGARGIAPWRKSCCSAAPIVERPAVMSNIDPQAWLADVLVSIAEHPDHRLDHLLPWNWSAHARSVAPPQAA